MNPSRLVKIVLLTAIFCLGLARAEAQLAISRGNGNIITEVVARGAQREPMLQVTVQNQNPAAGPHAELTELTVTADSSGTGNDVADLSTTGSVELFWDRNGDGRVTTGGATPDDLLGSALFDADNGRATIGGFVVTVMGGTKQNLLVTYNLGTAVAAGKSFRVRLAANSDLKAQDTQAKTPIAVTGAPVLGYLRTVGTGALKLEPYKMTPDGGVAIPNRRLLPVLSVTLSTDDVEDQLLSTLRLRDIGTANAVSGIVKDSVRLFLTATTQTTPPTDPAKAITNKNFYVNDGYTDLTPDSPIVVPRKGSVRLWVTIDVVDAQSETIGRIFQVQIPTTSSLTVKGTFSGEAPTMVGAVINGPKWDFDFNPVLIGTPSDLGAILMPPGARRYPLLAFQIKNDPNVKSEKAVITRFAFHADGTLNDGDAITSISLYRDTAPLGKPSPNDIYLGSGKFDADNGMATISFEDKPITLALAGTENFLVIGDLKEDTPDGQTVRLSFLSRDDMTVVGEISQANGSMVPSPLNGPYKTVGRPRAEFTLETNRTNIPTVVAPGAKNFPLLGFRVRNRTDEGLLFKGLHLKLTGPKDERNYFNGLKLWLDVNNNGIQEKAGGDAQVGTTVTLTSSGGESWLNLTIPDEQAVAIDRSVEKKFTLYADVKSTVVGDGTETFALVASADADIIAVGVGSEAQADYVTATPPFTEERTIRNPVIEVTANYPNPSDVNGCINGHYGMIGSRFTVASGEDLYIKRVRFSVSGTLNDSQFIYGASVWNDKNRDLYLSTSEYSDPFGYYYQENFTIADNGTGVIDIPGTGTLCKRNTDASLTVGIDFASLNPVTQKLDAALAKAQLGKTVQAAQIGNLIIEGTGARSGRPITVNNAPGDDKGHIMTFTTGSADVSLGKVDRTAGPPNGSNVEVFCLYIKTDILEALHVDLLKLKALGSLDESRYIKPAGMKLYIDYNRNGKVDSGDVQIATAEPPARDNDPVTFVAANYLQDYYGEPDNTVYSHPGGGKPYDLLLMTVDLTEDAPEGKTLQFALQSMGDLLLTGSLSLVQINSMGRVTYSQGAPPLTGPVVVVERGAIDVRTTAAFTNDADNKPVVTMAPGATSYEVLQMDCKATAAEDVELNGLIFKSLGTANELTNLKTSGVALYKGAISSANLLTSGTFTADNGTVRLTNFKAPVMLNNKTATNLRLAFTGSGSGQMGKDFRLTLAGTDLEAKGLSSSLPIRKILPADPYAAIPIVFGHGRVYVWAYDNDDYLLAIVTNETPRIQRLKFGASRVEGVRIDGMKVLGAGTADETAALQNGALLLNSRANPTAVPVLTASAPFLTGTNGVADLKGMGLVIDADKDTADRYSLDVALKQSGLVVGKTLRFDLTSTATSLTAIGTVTGQPVEVVFVDQAGGDNFDRASLITGRSITFSPGVVTLRKGDKSPADGAIKGIEQKLVLMHAGVNVAKNLEAVTISEIAVQGEGTANEKLAIGTVYLYFDADKDGKVTAPDVLIGTGSFTADNGVVKFSSLKLTYAKDTDLRWLVAADLKGTALKGQTIKVSFAQANPVRGTGQLTTLPISAVLGTPTPVGAVYTVNPLAKNGTEAWSIYE